MLTIGVDTFDLITIKFQDWRIILILLKYLRIFKILKTKYRINFYKMSKFNRNKLDYFFYIIILFVFFNIFFADENNYILLFFGLIFVNFFILNIKKIKINLFSSFSFLLYFIFSFFSLKSSINKEKSLTIILNDCVLFIIYIYCLNKKEVVKKNFINLIHIISIILFPLFILSIFFNLNFYLPSRSLLYSYSHSQIGNLFSIFFVMEKSFYWKIILLIGVLFSQSRTAYFALLIYFVINFFRYKKLNIKSINLLFIFIFLFSIIISTLGFFNKKHLLGNREKYIIQGLKYIKNHSKLIFDSVGAGNFNYISQKYAENPGEITVSSHNLFFDILLERGVLALIFFLFFLFNLIKKAKNDKYKISFILINVIFLLDFSFIYPIFLIFYYILAGLIDHSDRELKSNYINFFSYLFYLIILFFFISHSLTNYRFYNLAYFINPLNYKAVQGIIEKKIKESDFIEVEKYIRIYNKIIYDANSSLNCFNYFIKLNNKKEGLFFYEKYLLNSPLNLDYLPGFYELAVEVYKNERKAKEMTFKLLEKIEKESQPLDEKSLLAKKIYFFKKRLN